MQVTQFGTPNPGTILLLHGGDLSINHPEEFVEIPERFSI